MIHTRIVGGNTFRLIADEYCWYGLDENGAFAMFDCCNKDQVEPEWGTQSGEVQRECHLMVIFDEQIAKIRELIDPDWSPELGTYTCPQAEW